MSVAILPALWQAVLRGMAACLDPRSGWRLAVVALGLLFAQGRRRTVTTWLRAARAQADFPAFYYFLGSLGWRDAGPAAHLLAHLLGRLPAGGPIRLALDDTPTKRYGPKVQGAGVHHNPSPGPADPPFVYGHVWVTLAVVALHPRWGPVGLPVRALLYVRKKDVPKVQRRHDWVFRTKLELAAELVPWAADVARSTGRPVQVVADGAYAKRPFLKAAAAAGVTVLSRLRKDAALRGLPRPRRPGARGRLAVYGTQPIRLGRRARHPRGWRAARVRQYGADRDKRCKTFRATWRPAGGVIRVVVVREETGWVAWLSTDPALTAAQVLVGVAERAVIEQDFHDLKEVEGLGQPQVRDVGANVGVVQATLWAFTLVELWAWDQADEAVRDRAGSPWDDGDRRPSHADKRKALQRWCLGQEYQRVVQGQPLSPEMQGFVQHLLERAA